MAIPLTPNPGKAEARGGTISKTGHGCTPGRWRNWSLRGPRVSPSLHWSGNRGAAWTQARPRRKSEAGRAEAPPPPRACAGPARVSAQAPARCPPPQFRAGSERHLLDCSVRCRTTEVKAPRPCGERAARRKAYSVLGLRSSTTKAVAGSKVLPTWGRGGERDGDGERQRETRGIQTQTSQSDGNGGEKSECWKN